MTRLLQRLFGRLPIGWLQLTHKRGRFAAALAGVAFANVLVFVQLGLMNSMGAATLKPYRFGAVIFVFLGLAGCQSSLDYAANETSRFCTTRAHHGAPKQASSVDDIQFSNVHRATGGPVFSDCILVKLTTPSLIQIIAIDGSDSAPGRAYVLVDGEPVSSAEIGDAELVQLIVDARPGHNVVRFEIDGRPMEWDVCHPICRQRC